MSKMLLLFGCVLAVIGMSKIDNSAILISATPQTRLNNRPAVKACAEIEANLQPLVTPRILNDSKKVLLGEYPHTVAIGLKRDDDTISYICSGTLIAKRFVLTVAHCLAPPQIPFVVRMGVVDFNDALQMRDVVEIRVKEIHVHPQFSRSSVYNDIGLLELETDVNYTTNIYPACLYTETQDPPANSLLYVSGWGAMNNITRERSKVLQKARMTIVENQICNKIYKDWNRKLSVGIINSQLCAHELTEDLCTGYSGSPLNFVVDEALRKYRVVGVISSGLCCGRPAPTIYTRVSAFLDYIERIVWPRG